jgi:hypothetical protein
MPGVVKCCNIAFRKQGGPSAMSKLIPYFQSKIALAIIGTLVFGGGAALLASASFGPTTQAQTNTNISANANTTATPGTTIPGTTPTTTSAPSATPTATPTPRPPTPTSTPAPGIGQPTTLTGTVTSVNNAGNLFKVRSGGVTKTVTVTSQTTFTGACTSLSGMQTQWKVTVQGAYQDDGTFAATAVNSRVDD